MSRSTNRKPRSVDAISLLMADHRKVKGLLTALDNTTEKAIGRRKTLLKEIESEIKIHTAVEEEIFYPAYKDAARKSDQHLYYEALEEHHLVDIVLPEIKSTKVQSEEFGAKAKVLKDLIEHHAAEEETEMFPKARKLMGTEELRKIGKQIRSRKEALQLGVLTRVARTAGVAVGAVMNSVGKGGRKKAA
jgi:hemerythrin-like domain-containing protein